MIAIQKSNNAISLIVISVESVSQIGASVGPQADETNLNRDMPPMPNDGWLAQRAVFRSRIRGKNGNKFV